MQVSTNTFSEGLVMDFAPETTKNNCLTNALNATLVTMNGNELQLQNDMGNGKVYKAALPAGYVPLGTTELGGIIYIVSYNPLTNKCQIGSFPSPQRIKSSTATEEGTNDYNITAFNIDKFIISNEIINPGDKFYFTTPNTLNNYVYSEYLVDKDIKQQNFLNAAQRFIKIKAALLTNNNKLLYLDIPSDKILYEVTSEQQNSNNYWNVLQTKVSGKLVLVLQKVLFNYSAQINATLLETTTELKSTKNLIISLDSLFTSIDKFYPYGLDITLRLSQNDDEIVSGQLLKYNIGIANRSIYFKTDNLLDAKYEEGYDNDKLNEINRRINSINWNSEESKNTKLEISITPISYNINLSNKESESNNLYNSQTYNTIIDFDLIDSGTIYLNQYNYNVTFNNNKADVRLSLGLVSFLRKNEEITNRTIELFGLDNNYKELKVLQEQQFTTNNSEFSLSGLEPNSLYLCVVKITTSYKDEQYVTTLTRWLCTNKMYNSYNQQDFSKGIVQISIDTSLTCTNSDTTYKDFSSNYVFISTTREQTISRSIKISTDISTTINFNQDIPIKLISCKLEDKNSHTKLGTVKNNQYIVNSYEEQYNYSFADKNVEAQNLNLIPRALVPLSDFTKVEGNNQLTISNETDKPWTLQADGVELQYNNLTDAEISPSNTVHPINLEVDKGITILEPKEIKTDRTYIGLPTNNNKLYLLNVFNNEKVSGIFEELLNNLYCYRTNYVPTKSNLYYLNGSVNFDETEVAIPLTYTIKNENIHLILNNIDVEELVNKFKHIYGSIYKIPDLNYKCILSNTELNTFVNVNIKATSIEFPNIGDNIIVFDREMKSARPLTKNILGTEYLENKIYSYNGGTPSSLVNQVSIEHNDIGYKIDASKLSLNNNCLIVAGASEVNVKYSVPGGKISNTKCYYNIQPICSLT